MAISVWSASLTRLAEQAAVPRSGAGNLPRGVRLVMRHFANQRGLSGAAARTLTTIIVAPAFAVPLRQCIAGSVIDRVSMVGNYIC